MDESADKRIFSGDLKDMPSALKDLPADFKGALHMSMESKGKNYEADLLIQKNFIISSSLKASGKKKTLHGEEAFDEIKKSLKESTGTFDACILPDEEFKQVVKGNEKSLLELVRDLHKALEEINRDLAGDGEDLEAEWKNLEEEWKKIEEKEKPYLEKILGQQIEIEPEEEPPEEEIPPEEPVIEAEELPEEPAVEEYIPPEEPAEEEENTLPEYTPPEPPVFDAEEPVTPEIREPSEEEKLLDEQILGGGDFPEEPPEKKGPEEAGQERTEEPLEELREEPCEKPLESAQYPPEDYLPEDELLKREIQGLEERLAPEYEYPDAEREEEDGEGDEDEEEEKEIPPVEEDEETIRDRKILADQVKQELRTHIRKMKEGGETPAEDGTIPQTAQETPLNKPFEHPKPREWMEKASSEIQKLKQKADVYWGWDTKKKKFVGKEIGFGEEPPEEKPEPEKQQEKKEEKPAEKPAEKPQAPPEGIKPQIIEEPKEQPEMPEEKQTPELKKKIKFADKLKFMNSKETILILGTIDGKKTIEEIAKETQVSLQETKEIILDLAEKGYVIVKGG